MCMCETHVLPHSGALALGFHVYVLLCCNTCVCAEVSVNVHACVQVQGSGKTGFPHVV